jgi:hypothetical protein
MVNSRSPIGLVIIQTKQIVKWATLPNKKGIKYTKWKKHSVSVAFT